MTHPHPMLLGSPDDWGLTPAQTATLTAAVNYLTTARPRVFPPTVTMVRPEYRRRGLLRRKRFIGVHVSSSPGNGYHSFIRISAEELDTPAAAMPTYMAERCALITWPSELVDRG